MQPLSLPIKGVQMPLFFFDVTDDGDEPRHPDPIGTEHPSEECIHAEAVDLLANIARDKLTDGMDRTFSVSVITKGGSFTKRPLHFTLDGNDA
jgi:hypothetical protein